MSAWRQAALDAFPEAKPELLAMDKIEEVWPFLLPRLRKAVLQRDRLVMDPFLRFTEWTLSPKTGSRPGNTLKSLTEPMIDFIVTHISVLFEGLDREDFFKLQPGLKKHLAAEQMKAFKNFLKNTPGYIS